MSNAVLVRRRFSPVLVALLALILVIAAFLIGQRTAGSGGGGGQPAASAEQSHAHQEGEEGHGDAGHSDAGEEGHGEEGVIKFDPEALALAKLQVEPVAQRALQARLPVTGTVEPNLSGVVRITPRVAGKVDTVLVNVGDNVRAGQTVATLASTELADAQAQYRQARTRVSLAQGNLRRQRQLAGLGEFGRPKVEEARARYVTAQGELSDAQTELNAARTAVTEARSERAAAEGEVAAAESDVINAQSEAASAQSEIAEAESHVRTLRAALDQARTAAEVAQSKFNRFDTLLKEQLASRQDWEQARADARRAQSDIEASEANIQQGQAKVETARAHLRAAQAKVGTMQAKVTAEKGRVQQAAAKIQTALARQEQLEARVQTMRRQAEIAAQSLAREERVYRGRYLTTKEVVEAEGALRQAQAEQQAAADKIRLVGGTPGAGNVLPVLAPIAGRVTERTVTLGETVDPSKGLLTVVNLNTVWVQLAVPQRELPNLRVGQAVTITSDTAPGRTFNGAISYIGDVVDETTRAVKVRAVIQNTGNVLRPQTFVRGRIATEATQAVIAVPRDAVQTLEGKQVVFVQGDHPGEFETKEVEVGDTVGGYTVITSGLDSGARVVTRGAFTVKAQAMKSELGHEH